MGNDLDLSGGKHPAPVAYMARTRAYYQAQGFAKPYAWAHNETTPFTPLRKPLDQSTVGLVTTAATYPRKSLEPRVIDSGDIDARPIELYADDLSWDKKATHLDDVNSFLPVETLETLASEGTIGQLAPRYHCAATEYSQRTTLEKDAPEIHRRLLEDGVDVVLLAPL